jgi:diacylglycerol kinase family enzyme
VEAGGRRLAPAPRGSLASMQRLMLVANPLASGFTQSLHGDVVRILEQGYRVYAPWPESPDRARAETIQAARIGYDVVVAMGGDGTAHTVANGLRGSTTALGVVPAGTTNVLSRIAGFGTRPRQAAAAIVSASGRTRSLPSVRLDLEGPSGSETRVATFAAGVGYDAEAIEESERRPLRKVGFGTLHYVRSALRVAVRFRDRLATLRVEAAGRHADAVGVMVQVHDELTFVGGRALRLGPPPGPVAVTLERIRPLRIVRVATRALTGRRLDRVAGVRLWRDFSSLTVSAEPLALAEADGEVIGRVATLVATPQRDGLLIVAVPGTR